MNDQTDVSNVEVDGVSSANDAVGEGAGGGVTQEPAAEVVAAPKRARGRPIKADSKLNLARSIFNDSADKSRKVLVNRFVNEIPGVAKTVAGSYYHILTNKAK